MARGKLQGNRYLSDGEKSVISHALFFAILVGLYLSFPAPIYAKVTGNCVNCHTMHNSQNGVTMNGQADPMVMLLRKTCLGCHAVGGAQKIVTIGGQDVPQVRHTDSSDLAGGNFAYMLGDIGAPSNAKGHNVVDFGNPEDIIGTSPGVYHVPSDGGLVNMLRCAGSRGCHGMRIGAGQGAVAMQGAHHTDSCGKCDVALDTSDSYRFLRGVKGLENTGSSKWQNASGTDHNEYFGATTPMSGPPYCQNCHEAHGPTANSVKPTNQTISGFCGTCHWLFHSVGGIGGDTSSPFTRHPTDVVLPSTGEYASYTLYNTSAPVARTTVPDAPSSTVAPGTDVVMCLSCHFAHGSNFADILRWDYTAIIAGGGSSGDGCFICHTTKDTGS